MTPTEPDLTTALHEIQQAIPHLVAASETLGRHTADPKWHQAWCLVPIAQARIALATLREAIGDNGHA